MYFVETTNLYGRRIETNALITKDINAAWQTRASSVSAVPCAVFTAWGAVSRMPLPKVPVAGTVLYVYLCLQCCLGHEPKGFADVFRRLIHVTKMLKNEKKLRNWVKAEDAGSEAAEQEKSGPRSVNRMPSLRLAGGLENLRSGLSTIFLRKGRFRQISAYNINGFFQDITMEACLEFTNCSYVADAKHLGEQKLDATV